MVRKTLMVTVGLAVAVGLAGCWEDSTVTLHEAGKYKGTTDPLLSQQVATRTEALQKRFQLVQADR